MTPRRTEARPKPSGLWDRDAATPLSRDSAWSLFTRLSLIATAAVVLSLTFGGMAMYRAASLQDEQIVDSRLEQLGATILVIAEEQLVGLAPRAAGGLAPLKTRSSAALLYRYQVWGRDGKLLLHSHEASATAPMVALTRLGYSTTTIDGEAHRVFSLPGRNADVIVQVSENVHDAWSQVGTTTFYYAALLLIPSGLVLFVTGLLFRRALRSINALADELRARNPLDVALIPVADPPRELVPILRAIDYLFGRMQRALSIERSFTSLAAHELRTPLAGMRANAQLLTYEALPEEARTAVANLLVGVDRASHMLTQLLDLARVESLATSGDLKVSKVRLADVYEAVLLDLETRARKRNVEISSSIGEESLWCHRIGVSVLMRNLLTNAITYSPEGGRVELWAVPRGAELVLRVDDSGDGIPAADRERAFERFNRLGRTRADGGVGLGLSIVLLVVEMHGANIKLLDSPLGGLRVEVTFRNLPEASPASN